jgi:hypothetical protein
LSTFSQANRAACTFDRPVEYIAAALYPSTVIILTEGDAMQSLPMWHSMPMFGWADVILAGVIGLIILIALIATIPDLVRTMKIHSM